ncbi:MAG: hypothetical protein EX271_02950 [Acidimicrobiales bacterium]|nr:hypothetical protein [Hyphomonadaceae bacterium]RZV43893.1 MAG: hypothetical protein EX271_02950 [Acidimicrobiales bacterium]
MGSITGQLVLIAGAVSAFMGYDQVVKVTQYEPTQMLVTEVSSQCHLEKKSYFGVATKTSTTGKMDCTIAEIGATLDKFKGFKVKYHIVAYVDYFSPIDQSRQSGKLYFKKPKNMPNLGDQVWARASKKDIEKIRRG